MPSGMPTEHGKAQPVDSGSLDGAKISRRKLMLSTLSSTRVLDQGLVVGEHPACRWPSESADPVTCDGAHGGVF